METGTTIDLAGIADPTVDVGVAGGRELVAMARSAAARLPDASTAERVARALSPAAAVDAAAVAGAFELYNRVVDAGGLSVGKGARRELADIIATLDLDRMPHANL